MSSKLANDAFFSGFGGVPLSIGLANSECAFYLNTTSKNIRHRYKDDVGVLYENDMTDYEEIVYTTNWSGPFLTPIAGNFNIVRMNNVAISTFIEFTGSQDAGDSIMVNTNVLPVSLRPSVNHEIPMLVADGANGFFIGNFKIFTTGVITISRGVSPTADFTGGGDITIFRGYLKWSLGGI